MPGQRREQIVVKEADLRRCGHDLKLLRKYQLRPRSEEPAPPNAELEMSFKSAFAQRCRMGQELRDPWEGMKNPEYTRGHSEQDLVLNQVWVETLPSQRPRISDAATTAELDSPAGERNCSDSARTSSSAPAGLTPKYDGARSRRSRRSCPQIRCRSEGVRHAPSSSEPSPTATARSDGARRELRRPKSEVRSRIQPLESLEDEEEYGGATGSAAVQAAAREQRYGLRHLEGHLHYDSLPRAAWIFLHPKTGEVDFYHRAASERLEEAYRDRRASVPLAGLGRDIDNAIVLFNDDDGARMVEKSLRGRQRDVQRIQVPGDMTDGRVYVTQASGVWRFVREEIATAAIREHADASGVEERKLHLYGHEVVASPIKLPPVNPDRRTYFLNIGAESADLW